MSNLCNVINYELLYNATYERVLLNLLYYLCNCVYELYVVRRIIVQIEIINVVVCITEHNNS